jgi:WXG100 family type VII secretion target
MMAADYRVDLDGLQRLIDDTAKLEATLQDRAGQIGTRVDQLHVHWTGDAATAHKTAHDNRITALADMQDALTTLRQKLAAAREAYRQVGPTNLDMWP